MIQMGQHYLYCIACNHDYESKWNGVSSLSVFFPVTHPPEPLCEFCPNSVLLAQSSLFLLFDEVFMRSSLLDFFVLDVVLS